MSMKWQLAAAQSRRLQVMKSALADGIFTDHMSDGVCEQLLSEGWLERAAVIAARPHVNRANAYLPTDKALEQWIQQPAT